MNAHDLPQTIKSRVNLDLWAHNSIRDIVAGCVLNIRLHEAGICNKFICDMSDTEIERYLILLEELRRIMIKKLAN